MNQLTVKKEKYSLAKQTKELVTAQTRRILELVPTVVDQYEHDIKIAGKLQRHIEGDNLVNPSPVLADARSMNDYLKRVDIIKVQLLKAAGLIAPVAANVQVQQVFNTTTTNILSPELISMIGGHLELDDNDESVTEAEIVTQTKSEEYSSIESVQSLNTLPSNSPLDAASIKQGQEETIEVTG